MAHHIGAYPNGLWQPKYRYSWLFSFFYFYQEKDRAMDLMDACAFAEEMCNELVSISSAMENPGTILQATDKKGAPFLDVLIECELKQVKSVEI